LDIALFYQGQYGLKNSEQPFQFVNDHCNSLPLLLLYSTLAVESGKQKYQKRAFYPHGKICHANILLAQVKYFEFFVNRDRDSVAP